VTMKGGNVLRRNSYLHSKTLKIITVFGILAYILLAHGCVSKSDSLVGKVSKKIDILTRDDPDRQFNGKEVKPVTSLIDKKSSGFDGQSNPDNSDILNIDVLYKVKREDTGEGSGFFDGLPWNKPHVVITTLIPKTIANKQSVLSIDFSTKPSRVFDVGDNRYAEFELDEINDDQVNINIEIRMQLFQYDLNTAMGTDVKNLATAEDLKPFLKSETYIEKSDPSIVEIARQLNGTDEIDTVHNIYKYVLQAMTYDSDKAKNELAKAAGAVKALKRTKGVCVDYADLFIALCRAKGIPARYVGGVVTEDRVTTRGHAWVEVYLQSCGWTPFDPTWGDTGAASFYTMRPSYIYFTNVRNDEVIDNSNIFSYRYYGNREIDVDYEVLIDSGRMKYIGDMKSTIDEKRKELDQMKGRLNLLYREIDEEKRKLESDKAQLRQLENSLKSAGSGVSPGLSDYARKADKYNSLALEYNQEIQSHNQKVAEYEEYRKYYESNRLEFNELIDKYNAVN
jgi:transglutaminase-like putative cysteine protease